MFLQQFLWDRAAVISILGDTLGDGMCEYGARSIEQSFTSHNLTLTEWIRYASPIENNDPKPIADHSADQHLDSIKERARSKTRETCDQEHRAHTYVLCPMSLFQYKNQIDSLVQDCSNSSALAMELLQSCTKPSKYGIFIIKIRQSRDRLIYIFEFS